MTADGGPIRHFPLRESQGKPPTAASGNLGCMWDVL